MYMAVCQEDRTKVDYSRIYRSGQTHGSVRGLTLALNLVALPPSVSFRGISGPPSPFSVSTVLLLLPFVVDLHHDRRRVDPLIGALFCVVLRSTGGSGEKGTCQAGQEGCQQVRPSTFTTPPLSQASRTTVVGA